MRRALEGDQAIKSAIEAIGEEYLAPSDIRYGEAIGDICRQAMTGRIAVWGRAVQ